MSIWAFIKISNVIFISITLEYFLCISQLVIYFVRNCRKKSDNIKKKSIKNAIYQYFMHIITSLWKRQHVNIVKNKFCVCSCFDVYYYVLFLNITLILIYFILIFHDNVCIFLNSQFYFFHKFSQHSGDNIFPVGYESQRWEWIYGVIFWWRR